jgi:hypothetical protein
MEINKEWEILNDKLFNNQSLGKDEIMNAITSESKSVIHKIKRGLIIKSYWSLGFIAFFTILMFLSRNTPQAMVAVGIINFIYIIGFIFIRLEANRIDADFSGDDNVLDRLQANARIIKRAFRFEFLVFMIPAPLILLCFSLWIPLMAGETFHAILHDGRFLASTVKWCILLTPFVYFLGRYLHKKAFGPYLNTLNENIGKLQRVE